MKWQRTAFTQQIKFGSNIERSLYIVMRVKVWVSIADSPAIVSRDFMNVASGANAVAPQASKCSADSEIMTCNAKICMYCHLNVILVHWHCFHRPLTLKSWHPPQTTRCTDLNPGIALMAGRTSSRAFWAAARDFLSSSWDHFILHSLSCWQVRKLGRFWEKRRGLLNSLPGDRVEFNSVGDSWHCLGSILKLTESEFLVSAWG